MSLLEKLFGGRASAEDRELGVGVWRRAHDRFTRAVDRFYGVVAGIDDDLARARTTPRAGDDGAPVPGEPREALAILTHTLNSLADDVRGLCASAQALAPSDRLTVPAGPGGTFPELHRELSRAATLVAQAAEAATMTRVALRLHDEQAGSRARAAARAVERASDHVDAARRRLPS